MSEKSMGEVGNTKTKDKNLLFAALSGLFLFACAASVIKRLFIGYDIDEQYAVTLAYRIASGDILIKEMWEPHMLSGFLTALPVWLFLKVKGDAECLVIALRIYGILIQGLTTFLWYFAMRKKTNRYAALFSCAVIFFALPKFIQSPEFANTEIWFLILTGLLILLANQCEKTVLRCVWYALAGVAYLIVLCAYPSCILLLPLYLILAKKKENIACFLIPSLAFGTGFLIYLLVFVGAGNIMPNVSHILSDGSHAGGFNEKLAGYIFEIPQLLLHLAIYAAIAQVISLILVTVTKTGFRSGKYMYFFLCIFTAISFLDQLRFWLILRVPNVHPQYRFAALFLSAICLFVMMSKKRREEWKDSFYLFVVASFIGFLAILALTNLDIKATLVHLLPAGALGIAFFGEVFGAGAGADKGGAFAFGNQAGIVTNEDKRGTAAKRTVLACAVLATFTVILINYFGLNWLVRINNEGAHEDLHYGKQLSLCGPSKGIYCGYLDGMENNANYELLREKIPEGSKLLYVGPSSTVYLYNHYEICSPSVISTPTYDRGAIEYYDFNPDKKPDYIVLEKWYIEYEKYVSKEYMDWVEETFDLKNAIETEYVIVAEKKK